MFHAVIERILHLHGWVAYAIIFALPALEASVFLGFIFPGEIAVLLGGVLAFQGRITLGGAMTAAVAGAIVGDSVGYEVGKHFGPRLLEGPLRRFVKQDHRARATAFLRRHGGKAVFFGRFTAALRVLVPGFAGIAEIPYPTFLFYNAVGGAIWAVGFTLLGYLAGNEYRRVQHLAGRAGALLLALIVTVALIVFVARWIARNPERLRAWWNRMMQRPVLRWFRAPLALIGRRFQPGNALGLELTGGLVVIALLGIGFGKVLQDVSQHQNLFHLDAPLLNWLMRHTEGGVTTAMKVITIFGSSAFISIAAGLLAIWFMAKSRPARAFLIVVAPLGAFALERTIKAIVDRPPLPVQPLVHTSGSSFPSSHATLAAAFYLVVALLLARATHSWRLKVIIWTVVISFIGAIGFSRLYLRAHWLTDVLGGFALGTAWMAVVASGLGVWQRAREKAVPRTA